MKFRPLIAAIILAFFIPRPMSSDAASWFMDVPDNYVYRDSIWYMTATNVVSGYEDGTFLPETEINKVEALKIILNASGKYDSEAYSSQDTSADFTDLDKNAWYMEYIEKALSEGIISGNPDGTFTPENSVNRAEVLKMLFIASEVELSSDSDSNEEWYSQYIDYAADNSIIWPDES